MPLLAEISDINIELGDLIFYVKFGNQGNKLIFDIEQSAHVAIVVNIEYTAAKVKKVKKIEIAHATRPNNPSKPKAVIIEKLILPSDRFSYVVYRPKDGLLAKTAASIAQDWANKGDIKYDDERLGIMEKFLSKHKSVINTALTESKDEFLKSGYWRTLKFTIRDKNPISEGSQHGFRCDQFVILCYQVAAATITQLNSHIKKLPLLNENKITNVSLTHYNPKFLDIKNSLFNHYYQTKFQLNYVEKRNENTAPIIAGLDDELQNNISKNEGKSVVDYIPIPLDAKLCSPSVLLEFLMDSYNDGSVNIFQPIGILPGKPKKVPPSSTSTRAVEEEEERYINSKQDIYYITIIRKAVIDMEITHILAKEIDTNLAKLVIEEYSSSDININLTMYLYKYLLFSYFEGDENSNEVTTVKQCIGEYLDRYKALVPDWETKFISMQERKETLPVPMTSLNLS